jgi:pimeloyl-[acyl-carrier protein] methyl ester esterase
VNDTTICLSGWGQPHDALSAIAPDATHFDYAHHATPEEAISAIANAAKNHERIIGWSLGGQLAVRGIAAGLIKPKQLILVAVPFQFVKNKILPIGMPQDTYDLFIQNYAKNPARTLRKAWDLIAYNDVREAQVKSKLAKHDQKNVMEKNWGRWLEHLNDFSCNDLRFENFPPTLIIHGDQDAVVRYEQAQFFARHLPQYTLETLPGCGHAPHWHDTQKIQELIKKHV